MAAPVQGACLYPIGWHALSQHLPHKTNRKHVSFYFADYRYDAPASGAHRENSYRPDSLGHSRNSSAGGFVRLGVDYHERALVSCLSKKRFSR